MAVSKRTRYEVLRRDNHTCRYCGASAPEVKLTVDHVMPVALGGNDDPSNLVAACVDCNAGKASTSPDAALVADVRQDAIRWAAAIKLAGDRALARQAVVDDYVAHFIDEFRSYYGDPFGSEDIYRPVLPDNWESSIVTFYRRGLPLPLISHAVAKAATKARLGRYDWFRYFAGICWSMLTEIQDNAGNIVRSEDE